MARILLLDNYDSFTFNLLHYVEEFKGVEVDVFRNDQIAIEDVKRYDGILLSPGPGLPQQSGLLMPIINEYKNSKRIFGVCLGLQAIALEFGGELENLTRVYHGEATLMHKTEHDHYLFSDLPSSFLAGRYHSWVVSNRSLPSSLRVTATDDEGLIMAMCHTDLDICGVQFHPESILSPEGKKIIFNWLKPFVGASYWR